MNLTNEIYTDISCLLFIAGSVEGQLLRDKYVDSHCCISSC